MTYLDIIRAFLDRKKPRPLVLRDLDKANIVVKHRANKWMDYK